MFRASDIPQVVKSLSTEQQDVLMKYLYAGMGKPEQFNSSVLLTWHEKVKWSCTIKDMQFTHA